MAWVVPMQVCEAKALKLPTCQPLQTITFFYLEMISN